MSAAPRHDRTDRSTTLAVVSWSTEFGGAEAVLAEVVAGIPQRFDVVLVGCSESVLDRLGAGRPGHRRVQLVPRRTLDVRGVLALVRALRRLDADVVHLNLPWYFAALHPQLALLLLRHPAVLVHQHLPPPTMSRPKTLVARLLLRRPARVVSVGAAAAAVTAQQLRLLAGRQVVVHNGIAPRPVVPSTPVVAGGPTRLMAMGRVLEQKGFDVLLDALRDLPDCTVEMIGARTAEDRAYLEELAVRFGVADRLLITPWADDTTDPWTRCDVFVLSSRYEAAPLVLLEALRAGRPVVATAAGSAREVLGPLADGLVVPVGDARALAGAIRRVVDDPELRRRLEVAGPELVRDHYGSDQMVAGLVALYDELADEARPAREPRPSPQ